MEEITPAAAPTKGTSRNERLSARRMEVRSRVLPALVHHVATSGYRRGEWRALCVRLNLLRVPSRNERLSARRMEGFVADDDAVAIAMSQRAAIGAENGGKGRTPRVSFLRA